MYYFQKFVSLINQPDPNIIIIAITDILEIVNPVSCSSEINNIIGNHQKSEIVLIFFEISENTEIHT